jgi:pimeloyl-ACP methyl ester carboxylesterase
MRKLGPALVVLLVFLGCSAPSEPEAEPPAPAAQGDGEVASFDGVPIAYTVAGEGAGALVFIHGWSCDRGYWTGQLDTFADDYRVIAIDLAGHGDSGTEREEWTIESLARDVEAVVEALELDSVVLIGHSMGGPVALHAARRMPDETVGIVGVDTLQNFEFELAEEQWDQWIGSFEADFDSACANMVDSFFPEGADPELAREVRADMCDAPPAVATALFHDFRRLDYRTLAREAGVPIRCINAPAFPTEVENNRRYVENYDAYIMQDVGHFPMLERPEEFDRLLKQAIEELTSVDWDQL